MQLDISGFYPDLFLQKSGGGYSPSHAFYMLLNV